MNMYRWMGDRTGTTTARELAEELVSWHDAMVAHERRPGSTCDDECPHASAPSLWSSAVEVFGEGARDLVFLMRHGSRRSSRAAAGR